MNMLSKTFINFVAIVFATTFGASSSSFAATAIFDTGQLTGINQVDVSGSLYDVTFNASYSGVTYGDEFSLSAAEALTALFLTGGQFSGDPIDFDPTLTFGCTHESWCSLGTVATQLNATQIVDIYTIDNWYEPFDFFDGSGAIPTARFITSMDASTSFTYADWTLSNVGVVPVPAAVWLFGTGILGLIGFSKRRKAA
jgi:hypothetical protein